MREEDSLRLAINESVRILPYDVSWPEKFEREKGRLMELFPANFSAIEHIGSTAVPLLSAQPVIDLMAGVRTMEEADAILPGLCGNGYTTSAEFNATLANRRWLMRHEDGHRTHHLHLVVFESSEWLARLRFRNVLRSNAEIARRYLDLKVKLARATGSDREAYTVAKTEFVASVLNVAR